MKYEEKAIKKYKWTNSLECLTCVGKSTILYVLFEEDIDFGKHLKEKVIPL